MVIPVASGDFEISRGAGARPDTGHCLQLCDLREVLGLDTEVSGMFL